MHTIIMTSCPGLTLIGLSGTAQDQPLACSRQKSAGEKLRFQLTDHYFLDGGGGGGGGGGGVWLRVLSRVRISYGLTCLSMGIDVICSQSSRISCFPRKQENGCCLFHARNVCNGTQRQQHVI